jgi:amino acid transporter
LDKSVNDPANAGLLAIEMYLGNVGVDIVRTLMATSIFACVLAIHNILGRYIYSLSIDGVFPKFLGEVHPRHGSPHKSSAAVVVITLASVAASVITKVEPYSGYASLVGIAGYTLLILQILTTIAVLVFFRAIDHTANAWQTFIAPMLALVGLMGTGWLATSNIGLLTGSEQTAAILLTFLFGALVLGTLYAIWLKSSKPNVYRVIGRQEI